MRTVASVIHGLTAAAVVVVARFFFPCFSRGGKGAPWLVPGGQCLWPGRGVLSRLAESSLVFFGGTDVLVGWVGGMLAL